ncbi:MAG: serine hydrolase domain-containing protein [Vicinamibacterales bacterium]|nr:serine hydrolase domain-containing protein [Vicinamibacterales bacterium]
MAAVRIARLEAYLARVAARRDVPHIVMGVESVDGRFRWAGASGPAAPEGPAMTPETPYFIASIDKLFNAIIAMTLVEQGTLDLDAPLPRYLPATLWTGLHRVGDVDRSGDVRVAHLLSHTSGLPDWLEDRPAGGASLVARVEREGDVSMSMEEMAAYVRDRLTPHFPPQDTASPKARARYSDTNYMLLAAILEAVTGGPLAAAHQHWLYRPLGMTRTWVEGQSRPGVDGAAPAALWFGDRAMAIPGLMRSFRGVFSTVGDQVRLLRALVRGELFEQPETLGRMQHWRRFGLPRDAAALRAPNWPIEYGFGMMRFAVPRWLPPFRPAPAVVGHTGSTGTWLFHCPERDLLVAGAVDQVTAGPLPFRTLPALLRAL